MAEGYQAVDHCKRWDICMDIRDCPLYRGVKSRMDERLGEGLETVEGNYPNVSIVHFDGTHQEDGRDARHRVFLMANKYEGTRRSRIGSRNIVKRRECYVNIVMEHGPPELKGELQEIHSERRLKLMGADE